MHHRKLLLAAAITGVMAMTSIQTVAAADENAADKNMEKCYGVAKAGKNDCASAAHACAGHGSMDKSGSEWVKLPKGACERLVGGSLTPISKSI
jgi:uncharacterized membrane protein